jgi:hypothetical protein
MMRTMLAAAAVALSLVPGAARAQVDTVAIQVAALRMIWLDPELTHGAPVRCLGEWTPETGAAPVDPQPGLMARLAASDPPVVPRSACASPVEFWVDQPHRIDKSDAAVTVSSRCGYTCGWSAECYVELYGGREWRASRCVMRGELIKDPDGDDGADEPLSADEEAEIQAAALGQLWSLRPDDGRTEQCLETSIRPGEAAPVDSGYVDAYPELLARLGAARRVRPVSRCVADAERAPAGQAFVRHRIGRPFLLEPGTYLIAAAEYCGPRCGTTFTCRVQWVDGEWTGTGCESTTES